MLIINGIIFTQNGSVIEKGWVRTEKGRIAGLGEMSNAPGYADDEVIDADRLPVTPGLIDAHCHLGLFEDSSGEDGGNEDTDPVTPHLRVIDAINPFDRYFTDAIRSGVTTVVVSPGSANPIGGQIAAIKTAGRRVDDMALWAPLALKCALGENPKKVYGERKHSPATRMATAALIRENINKAKEYLDLHKRSQLKEDADPPDYDIKLESLLPVIKREIPVHFHAHRADDMFTAIRLAKELNLEFVLVHGSDSALVGDILGAEGVRVICGPLLSERSKPELRNLTFDIPHVLHKNGVPFAICTDAPVIPIEYLPLCAALSVKSGLDKDAALSAITSWAADICGLGGKVGRIKQGLSADLVIWSGDPLALESRPVKVLIEGNICFEQKEKSDA